MMLLLLLTANYSVQVTTTKGPLLNHHHSCTEQHSTNFKVPIKQISEHSQGYDESWLECWLSFLGKGLWY